MNPIIELKNVGMSFGEHVVHKDINLTFSKGEVVTLLGPSGTGKTVVLKLIIALLFPTKGTVNVLGRDTKNENEDQLRELRRHIGMLFQGAALFDSLNVYDNIAFPLREIKTPESEIKKIVYEKLEIVNLEETKDKFPPQLSGGQKKRIGLARALATSPDIMLFDEPTTGLDPTARKTIDSLIMRLKEQFKITSIVITHDIESAYSISDRLVMLSDGFVVADGSAKELWNNDENIIKFAKGNWYEE